MKLNCAWSLVAVTIHRAIKTITNRRKVPKEWYAKHTIGLEECILPRKSLIIIVRLLWSGCFQIHRMPKHGALQLWTSLAKCDAQGSLEIHHSILCGMQASILHSANPRIVSFIACKTTRVKGQMQIVSRLARFVCVCKPGFAKLTVDYTLRIKEVRE